MPAEAPAGLAPNPLATCSSEGFLSKPRRPDPPDCLLVSGKLPTPLFEPSVLPFFAALPWCDDWVSPPDCTDFFEQPETPIRATLATSAMAILKHGVPMRVSPLSTVSQICHRLPLSFGRRL